MDTKNQVACEDWIRKEWLPQRFGQAFRRAAVPLGSGGVHSFDAVSNDGNIVAVISTSCARTAKGRRAIGKMNRLRSDLYFLHLAQAKRPVVVVTETEMYERCLADQATGLIPGDVEILLAVLPPQLAAMLRGSKDARTAEIPGKRHAAGVGSM